MFATKRGIYGLAGVLFVLTLLGLAFLFTYPYINLTATATAILLVHLSFLAFVPILWLIYHQTGLQSLTEPPPVATDISPTIATLPGEGEDNSTVSHLHALGFRYVGTVGQHTTGSDEPMTPTYMFVDDTETISAECGQLNGVDLVGFEAHLGTPRILQVSYPWGENMRTKPFVWRYTTTSLAAAYQELQALIEQDTPKHGHPQRVRTMADVLARHEVFNQVAYHHQQRRLRWFARAQVAGLVIFSLYWLWTTWQIYPDFRTISQGEGDPDMYSTAMMVMFALGIAAMFAPLLVLAEPVIRLVALQSRSDEDDD